MSNITVDKWQYGYAIMKEYEDGTISVTVGINENAPDDFAVFTVAAPNVGRKERQRRVNKAMDDVTMRGYIVTDKYRVKNPAFDSKWKFWQKTTTVIKARPCRGKKEAERVAREIKSIIRERIDAASNKGNAA